MQEVYSCDVFYEDTVADIVDEARNKVSPADALVLSKNHRGRVDLPFMEEVSGLTNKELIHALKGNGMWQDPVIYDYDLREEAGWMLGEQYFSGNLVKRLKDAEYLNRKYRGRFWANVTALKARLPELPELEDIYISLGAAWVPEDYYARFIGELLDSVVTPEVTYMEYMAKWKISTRAGYSTVKNNDIYGSRRMSAVKIIENTMNAIPIRVMDKVQKGYDSKTVYVLNREETLAAQEKQILIIREFEKWIHADPAAQEHLQELYSERYGYAVGQFDGSFLELPGLNPEVTLYPHQRNAVARIVLCPNVLLAHDVGAGKTYEMVIGAHELKRMNLSEKNLLVIPNNVLDAVVRAHQYLYPEDKILAIYPKDFTPSKRKAVLDRIREEDFTAIYMAYSSFDMLRMSLDYYIRKAERKMREYNAQLHACQDYTTRANIKTLRNRLRKRLEKLKNKREEGKEAEAECFETLGITAIFLDEAHNYKNITVENRKNHVVGLSGRGSDRSNEMLEKVHYVQKCGGRIIFATGTPLTNSLADLFVLQTYLQPRELALCGIERFPQWLNSFAERESSFEMDVDSSNFRFKTRFSRFHNLPELMAMFASVCDFYQNGQEEMDLPVFTGYSNVQIGQNEQQKLYLKDLVERTERIRSHDVDPAEDNLLKITIDGRKCALDIRLVMPEVSKAEAGGKIAVCCEEILKMAEKHPGCAQLVFCDTSTPKAGFNVYDALKEALIQGGLSDSEIAFIHDGTTVKKKQFLIRQVNQAGIRVMIGSTQKLGTGVNVQDNLIAVHHLDIPWRPADMSQREGRIIRTGNKNHQVYIFRYVTESSFDAYTYQILENKQKFIASFLSGTLSIVHRDEKDLEDTVLDYAEIKALAIGNPLIKKRVRKSNELERVKLSRRRKQRQLHNLQTIISRYPDRKKALCLRRKRTEEDYRHYQAYRKKVGKSDRVVFGKKLLHALEGNVMREKGRLFDQYQGFYIILPPRMQHDHPFIMLRNKDGQTYDVDMKDAKVLGCSSKIDYALERFPVRIEKLSRALQELETDVAAARYELDKGNPFDKIMADLQSEIRKIDEILRSA